MLLITSRWFGNGWRYELHTQTFMFITHKKKSQYYRFGLEGIYSYWMLSQRQYLCRHISQINEHSVATTSTALSIGAMAKFYMDR